MQKSKKVKIVAVSGGFDPLHIGHVRMFIEAKKLAGKNGKLIVIINNDNWLKAKKGYAFMPERQRAELIAALRSVDYVILSKHKPKPKDMSVAAELKRVKPDIFANGGDRKAGNTPTPEAQVCQALKAKMVFNVGQGGKVESSSWLLNKFLERNKSKK